MIIGRRKPNLTDCLQDGKKDGGRLRGSVGPLSWSTRTTREASSRRRTIRFIAKLALGRTRLPLCAVAWRQVVYARLAVWLEQRHDLLGSWWCLPVGVPQGARRDRCGGSREGFGDWWPAKKSSAPVGGHGLLAFDGAQVLGPLEIYLRRLDRRVSQHPLEASQIAGVIARPLDSEVVATGVRADPSRFL